METVYYFIKLNPLGLLKYLIISQEKDPKFLKTLKPFEETGKRFFLLYVQYHGTHARTLVV